MKLLNQNLVEYQDPRHGHQKLASAFLMRNSQDVDWNHLLYSAMDRWCTDEILSLAPRIFYCQDEASVSQISNHDCSGPNLELFYALH